MIDSNCITLSIACSFYPLAVALVTTIIGWSAPVVLAVGSKHVVHAASLSLLSGGFIPSERWGRRSL
jgi:hypothetical protein